MFRQQITRSRNNRSFFFAMCFIFFLHVSTVRRLKFNMKDIKLSDNTLTEVFLTLKLHAINDDLQAIVKVYIILVMLLFINVCSVIIVINCHIYWFFDFNGLRNRFSIRFKKTRPHDGIKPLQICYHWRCTRRS